MKQKIRFRMRWNDIKDHEADAFRFAIYPDPEEERVTMWDWNWASRGMSWWPIVGRRVS